MKYIKECDVQPKSDTAHDYGGKLPQQLQFVHSYLLRIANRVLHRDTRTTIPNLVREFYSNLTFKDPSLR